MPALAIGAMNKQPVAAEAAYIGGRNEHWDIVRDELREFGNLKLEIKETGWEQQRENAKYFYEQRAAIDRNNFDTAIGFKQSEILGLQNKGEILGRIDGLEKRLDQDIIRKQGEELNYLKTVMALAPKPPVPAYFPNYNAPVQHNVYAMEPGYYPSHG